MPLQKKFLLKTTYRNKHIQVYTINFVVCQQSLFILYMTILVQQNVKKVQGAIKP